jgi:hypothetical protein
MPLTSLATITPVRTAVLTLATLWSLRALTAALLGLNIVGRLLYQHTM